MENKEKKLDTNEKITMAMIENKDFCVSIVNCKDREEVKKFLESKGISVTDSDIDDLAKNISEIADVCKKLSDVDLENIVGGGGGGSSSGSSSSRSSTPGLLSADGGDSTGGVGDGVPVGSSWWDVSTGGKVFLGIGLGAAVVGSLGVLSVVAAEIKKAGDKKGWWNKKHRK